MQLHHFADLMPNGMNRAKGSHWFLEDHSYLPVRSGPCCRFRIQALQLYGIASPISMQPDISAVIFPGLGISPIIALAVMFLPQPLSPTRPRVSPRRMSRFTPSGHGQYLPGFELNLQILYSNQSIIFAHGISSSHS